jgi:diguanylate cyclase (GGDEF)-like protein
MIETLCIAAEITAALLLFSLARPRKNCDDDRGTEELLAESLQSIRNGEQAIQTLQLLSILTAVKSPDAIDTDAEATDVPSLNQRLGELFSAINPLLPSMPTEGLTDLRDRKAIESLIDIASDWQSWLEHPIRIAIFQPDGLADIDSIYGPVAGEKLVRATADFLKSEIGGRGLITRFGFQSFAIALIGYSDDEAVNVIERIRSKASSLTWNIAEAEIHSTYSASLAEVVSGDQVDLWEIPEDGLATCIAHGGNRGYWHDFSDATWKPMSDDVIESPSIDDKLESAHENIDQIVEDHSLNVDEAPKSTETSVHSDVTEATAAKLDANHEVTSPVSGDENSVSTEDLAALFQAAKSSMSKKPNVAPEEPSPENDDLNSKATNDDIAALFETVRDAVKPKPLAPEVAKATTTNLSGAVHDKPALKSPEEMGVAASEDDIAALFNAFKK